MPPVRTIAYFEWVEDECELRNKKMDASRNCAAYCPFGNEKNSLPLDGKGKGGGETQFPLHLRRGDSGRRSPSNSY